MSGRKKKYVIYIDLRHLQMLMKVHCCIMVVKKNVSPPVFSPCLSFHPLICLPYSKRLCCSRCFQCDIWVLTRKDGFPKIKSLYIHRKHLSCMAVFTSICSMLRQSTGMQNCNHNVKPQHLFWRSNSNLSKIWFWRLPLSLNSCW